jgi:putative ABC transport system substrate-binding protein
VERRNTRIETRWATPDVESIQRFAKELAVSTSTRTTASLLQQTRTVPIVFAAVGDPIGSGFVTSLPRPVGNATGFSTVEGSLGSK